jgi:excisionase family DNA binding protein
MSKQSKWVGQKEARDILGVARNTLKRLMREGILPAYQIEGVVGYRFKRDEVEALIRRVVPGVPPKKKYKQPKHSPTRKVRRK